MLHKRAKCYFNNACKTLTNGQHAMSSTFTQSNTKDYKIPIEALRIAVTLKQKKLTQFKENDKNAYFKIASKVNDYLSSICNTTKNEEKKPSSCLSKESINEIYNKSVTMEKTLLPNFHMSVHGAPILKSSFTKYVEEKKFCQLDIDAFLDREQDNLLLHIKPVIF